MRPPTIDNIQPDKPIFATLHEPDGRHRRTRLEWGDFVLSQSIRDIEALPGVVRCEFGERVWGWELEVWVEEGYAEQWDGLISETAEAAALVWSAIEPTVAGAFSLLSAQLQEILAPALEAMAEQMAATFSQLADFIDAAHGEPDPDPWVDPRWLTIEEPSLVRVDWAGREPDWTGVTRLFPVMPRPAGDLDHNPEMDRRMLEHAAARDPEDVVVTASDTKSHWWPSEEGDTAFEDWLGRVAELVDNDSDGRVD